MPRFGQLDAYVTARRLTEWLELMLPDAAGLTVTDVEPASATTLTFTASWHEGGEHCGVDLFARAAADAGREFRVLRALVDRTDVPVPVAHWHEADPAVLGSQFLVCERVDGGPLDDDASGVEVLAAVQAVDWQAIGLSFLDDRQFGDRGVGQQIRRWEDAYSQAELDDPTIEAGFEWVREVCPPHDTLDVALSWGDARPSNIVAGEDGAVRAALGWRLATVASPEQDLGSYVLFGSDRDAIVARWEELTGRVVDYLDFYETFAALRWAIRTRGAEVALRRLAELGDLPPP